MYIQPHRDFTSDLPLSVPRDYSGHTFRMPQPPVPKEQSPPSEPQEQAPQPEPSPAVQEPSPAPPESPVEEEETAKETVPCSAPPQEKGLLSRIPFLSSLLPPKRHGKREGELPEWAIIGLILLLLTDENGDILPFLLLLLLWD